MLSPANPLIIAGMPRSGTTLLRRLCNRHSQMRVTNDFGNYAFIGDLFPVYVARSARRVLEINGESRIEGTFGDRRTNYVGNVRAVADHVLRLARYGVGPVTLSALATEARRGDPAIRVVGDKFPQYIFKMDRFVELQELLRLVIYRDCRDVTSSYLRMIRTKWKHRRWIRSTDTAEKIARSWVRAIENMEYHAERLYVIRYEDLVSSPRSELQRLAEWLDVDPLDFDGSMVFNSSVGKYQQALMGRELEDVLRVAGPALERLEYALD